MQLGDDTVTFGDDESADGGASTLDAAQQYLASLEMTSGELLVGNLALIIVGGIALYAGLAAVEAILSRIAKRRGKDFQMPLPLAFPAPQVMIFFMVYPGCIQTCLITIHSACAPWPYRILAGVMIAGITFILVSFARMVIGGRFQVPFDQSDDDHDASAGNHALFVVKSERHETVKSRYREFFTRLDRADHGEWRANSPHGESIMATFSGLFAKFGPHGIMLYFGDAMRKLLMMIIISLTASSGGSVQGVVVFLLSTGEWIYIFTRLPYNTMSNNIGELVVMFGQTTTLLAPLLGRLEVLSWSSVSNQMICMALATTAFNICRLATGIPRALIGVTKYLGGAAKMAASIGEAVGKTEPAIRREVKRALNDLLPTYSDTFNATMSKQVEDHTPHKIRVKLSHAAGMEAVCSQLGLDGDKQNGMHKAAAILVIDFVSAAVAEVLSELVLEEVKPRLMDEIKDRFIYVRIPGVQTIVLRLVSRALHLAITVAIRNAITSVITETTNALSGLQEVPPDDAMTAPGAFFSNPHDCDILPADVEMAQRVQPGTHDCDILPADVETAQRVEPGTVMLAPPSEFDRFLRRQLVLILELTPDGGAVGLALDNPTPYSICEAAPAIVSGPLQTNVLFRGGTHGFGGALLLHSCARLEGATPVGGGFYVGGVTSACEEVSKGAMAPHEFKFFFDQVHWSREELADCLVRQDGAINSFSSRGWQPLWLNPRLALSQDSPPGSLWLNVRQILRMTGAPSPSLARSRALSGQNDRPEWRSALSFDLGEYLPHGAFCDSAVETENDSVLRVIPDAQGRDAVAPLGTISTVTANADETVPTDSKPSCHQYRPTKTTLFYPLFAAQAPTELTNETERFGGSTNEAKESATGKANAKPHGWARFAHLIRPRRGIPSSAMQPPPGPTLAPIEIPATSARLLDAPPTSESPDAPTTSARRLEGSGDNSGSAGHGRQEVSILVASNKDDLHGGSIFDMNFAFCSDMADEAPSGTENHLELGQGEDGTFTLHF